MRKHPGFTLIEVIVAVSIIAIVATMLIVGLQYVSASSREKTTRITLANAQAMLAELEATAGLSRLPYTGAVYAPSGPVVEGSGYRMNDAVRATRDALAVLRAVPANRATMDQLPPETVAVPAYDDAVAEGDGYKTGDQVMFEGTVYRATGAANSAPSGGNWAVASDPVPLLLDAWNNPIIFVPPPHVGGTSDNPDWGERYGLRGVEVESESDLRVVNPGGINLSGRDLYPSSHSEASIARLRHFRPFFVSAGPDGDFRTHDDNLYSFEN